MSRLPTHFKSHVARWIVIGLALTALTGRPATVRAEMDDVAQRLEVAIDEARTELREEGERIAREKQAQRQRLDALQAECRELADELVERKLAIKGKQQTLAELRERREKLWGEKTQWQEELAEIALICGDVQTELARMAQTTPVSESRAEQEELLSQFAEMPIEDAPQEASRLALDLIGSFLHEARTSAVYESEIIDPQGKRRQATLLRVGQNLFACRIPKTAETAIAVAAPYEQSGFRWQNQLPNSIQASLLEAIEEASGPAPAGPIWLPMDVTGQMAATTNLQARDLWDRLRSGGIVMIPLAFVALSLALLIADRFLVLLRESRHSLRFCDRVLGLCAQGEFEEAERIAERKKGVLPRVLTACLAHRASPPAVLDDAIQETLLHEFPKLERFLPSIRMLSAVAPMLGLLGTVTGIITTFDVITVVGSGQPRLMAGGISEALITTATGLAIAIPGLLAHSVLSGKADGIIADTERFAATASNLVKQHQHKTGNGQNKQDEPHGTPD